MKVNPVQQNQTFSAKVVKTEAFNDMLNCISKNYAKPEQTKFSKCFDLWYEIEYAMKKHPSYLDVFTIVEKNMGDFGYATASIKTFAGEMSFKTMANLGVHRPVLNVWRDFLDPENKAQFNNIMGNRFSKNYDFWWNKYIKPYWKEIDELFRDKLE